MSSSARKRRISPRRKASSPGATSTSTSTSTSSSVAPTPSKRRRQASSSSKSLALPDASEDEEIDAELPSRPFNDGAEYADAEEEAREEARQLQDAGEEWRAHEVKTKKFVKELSFEEKVDRLEDLLGKAEAYSRFLADRHKESLKQRASGSQGENFLFEQPPTMTGGQENLRLREYQRLGASWLEGLVFNGLHGILADEMGLGKTIQVIAVIAHLKMQGMVGPFLIVAPLSTLKNWQREFARWCPGAINTLLYHGTKDEREELRQTRLGLSKSRNNSSHRVTSGKILPDFPVVITSYDIMMRDSAHLRNFEWAYLVVDEGHRLKNKDCRLMKELKSLNTKQRLLLTGTPLQNNLTELWSLLNFLMPDAFDDLQFFQAWFGWDSREEDEMSAKITKGAKDDDIVSKLHRILAPFMMRRLKSDVATELPLKKEIVVYVGMTPAQSDLYNRIVTDMAGLSKILGDVAKSQGKRTTKGLMNRLMQLRKCCNHPYLFADSDDTDETLVQMSGKLVLMDKLMAHFYKTGHKVLIFSQFTTMLDIIQDYFWLRGWANRVCRIDGSVKMTERQVQIDEFNRKGSEKAAFLLSTRAGGVGINLASADTVIIFDSDWNPHMDSQAQDRAHRIGQKNNVVVYRLVTEGSVELKILERANAKRSLERLTMAGFQGQSKIDPKKAVKAMAAEVVEDLLSKDINITAEQRKGKTGGIKDAELKLILDREYVCSERIPKKGKGYEIVEHKATSLVGKVDHGASDE